MIVRPAMLLLGQRPCIACCRGMRRSPCHVVVELPRAGDTRWPYAMRLLPLSVEMCVAVGPGTSAADFSADQYSSSQVVLSENLTGIELRAIPSAKTSCDDARRRCSIGVIFVGGTTAHCGEEPLGASQSARALTLPAMLPRPLRLEHPAACAPDTVRPAISLRRTFTVLFMPGKGIHRQPPFYFSGPVGNRVPAISGLSRRRHACTAIPCDAGSDDVVGEVIRQARSPRCGRTDWLSELDAYRGVPLTYCAWRRCHRV